MANCKTIVAGELFQAARLLLRPGARGEVQSQAGLWSVGDLLSQVFNMLVFGCFINRCAINQTISLTQ